MATDLSSRSEPAIKRAAQLASNANARLTLLHVVDGALPAELMTSRREQTQGWLASHISADLVLPLDVQVRNGDSHVRGPSISDVEDVCWRADLQAARVVEHVDIHDAPDDKAGDEARGQCDSGGT